MPLGSSSEAPVIRPAPRRARIFLIFLIGAQERHLRYRIPLRQLQLEGGGGFIVAADGGKQIRDQRKNGRIFRQQAALGFHRDKQLMMIRHGRMDE